MNKKELLDRNSITHTNTAQQKIPSQNVSHFVLSYFINIYFSFVRLIVYEMYNLL